MGIAERLQPTIAKYGLPVQVGVRKKPIDSAVVTPCPCTIENNPWHTYNSAWHQNHPTAPDCHGTGKLVDSIASPLIEIRTIQAVVLPNYGATGNELDVLPPGSLYQWPWLAITQDTSVFDELQFTDETGAHYRFKVKNPMPYYVENRLNAPAAIIYGLVPVETSIPMEEELAAEVV